MKPGFSFDRALFYTFQAPHAGSFIWRYVVSYAVVVTAFLALIASLGWQDAMRWFQAVEAASASPLADETEILSALFGHMLPLMRWGVVMMVGFWAIWAMFEAASQRRYVRGDAFALGFGGDELRLMGLGIFWALLGLVTMFIPMALIYGGMFSILLSANEDAAFEAVLGWMLAGFGLMFVMFPLYVFLATRLAPSFGLTIKERRIRFFDAWNVSRGRFWPILGAFAILVVVGGIASQVLQVVVQMIGMSSIMTIAGTQNVTEDDVAQIFLAPGFLIPMGIVFFLMMAMQGFLQHLYGAPAALAALHDPRNDPAHQQQVDIFS